MTGWQVDDQPLDLALGDRGELGRDHLDVPVWQKRRLWVEFAETALGEITEIGSQDRVVFARRKVFDHAPPPRSRAFMRAMICWSASVKVGSAEWGSLSPSMSRSIANRIWMALKSALAERLTSWVTIASRLVTTRRPPLSVTTTSSLSALVSSVFIFLAPGGRPRGLPDWPLTKRVWRGGLP